MGLPAATIVGPVSRPLLMPSRRAVTAWMSLPRSRMVVKPASSVRRALSIPITMSSSSSRLKPSIRARTLSSSLKMWTWLSIRPGSTNWSRRSTTWAPAAPTLSGAAKPSFTASILPPRTTMVLAPRGAWPGLSSSEPAWMTTTFGAAGWLWAPAWPARPSPSSMAATDVATLRMDTSPL